MFVHFSVRQILKRDFGVAFPVVGGIGNSAKDPAIIESEAGRNYHHAEYDYTGPISIFGWKGTLTLFRSV